MKQDTVEGVVVEAETYRKVTLYLPERVTEGMQACAQRDSRSLDHMYVVGLESYIDSRKLTPARRTPAQRRRTNGR